MSQEQIASRIKVLLFDTKAEKTRFFEDSQKKLEESRMNPADFNLKHQYNFVRGRNRKVYVVPSDDEIPDSEEKKQETGQVQQKPAEHQDADSSSSVDFSDDDLDLDVSNVENGTSARTQKIYEMMLRRQNQNVFVKQDVGYQQEKWNKAGKDVVIPAFNKRYEKLCSNIVKTDEPVKAEEDPSIKAVERMLRDRSKNPFEFLRTHPESVDYLFD